MTVLVFGATGQLGHRLLKSCEAHGIAATGITHAECDFSRIAEEDVLAIFMRHSPALIINAAAYTAVDKAEGEFDLARQVNAEAPAIIASAAAERHIPFIHFSTDYVFDGKQGAPYGEDAVPHPLNRYGMSKLAGEELARAAHPGAYIFRLQWLYDTRGSNFFRTMCTLLQEKKELRVVADQLGTPSYAPHLAEAVVELLPRLKKIPPGIHHLVPPGHTSWHGFATAIRGAMKSNASVAPVTSEEYPQAAPRPKDARLRPSALVTLPHWRAGLAAAMEAS